MSLFGDLWDGVKAAGSKVFGAAKKVAIKVKEVAKNVVEKCSKVWAKFTGKEKFDKANKLYDELKMKMEAAKRDYSDFVSNITKNISNTVTEINTVKKELTTDAFSRFVNISGRIACWEIVIERMSEEFSYNMVKIDEIKAREELFSIDFNRDKIKTNILAVVTFGFLTRKRATETLHEIQEQEKVLECEVAKIEVEKKRLVQIHKSLKQVNTYFCELRDTYSKVLNELDYVINLISISSHLANPAFAGGKIDCYFMPREHLYCLMVSEKMTRILHEMARLRYLGKDGNVIKKDHLCIKERVDEISTIKLKIAA